MLYIFAYDETSKSDIALKNVDGSVTINSIVIESHVDYKNLGEQISVFKHNKITLDGIKKEEASLQLNVDKKAHSSSFFPNIANIFKPSQFLAEYAKVGDDVFMFFTDTTAMEYFVHEKLSAKPCGFNDKNDDFNFIAYDYNREYYVSGEQSFILDIANFCYNKLECEGATFEHMETLEHNVPVMLNRTDDNPNAEHLCSAVTDTYKLTFATKGMYIIRVITDTPVYKTQQYAKVFIC